MEQREYFVVTFLNDEVCLTGYTQNGSTAFGAYTPLMTLEEAMAALAYAKADFPSCKYELRRAVRP